MNLGLRTLTAALGAPLVLGAMWVGGLWWAALLAVVALLGTVEFGRLHPEMSRVEQALVGAGAFLVAVIAVRVGGGLAVVFFLGALFALTVALSASLMSPLVPEARWRGWKAISVGVVYLGLPVGVLLRWRLEAPFTPIAWVFAAIWANDIAAYFVGLTAGRHKIAPQVSPGKSWEGAVAGFIAGMAIGALAAPAWGLAVAGGALLGAAASVVSQSGDFFESAMKRRAGVKDSGSLLPGHGGILDRFDGVLVAVPFAYALLATAAILSPALR